MKGKKLKKQCSILNCSKKNCPFPHASTAVLANLQSSAKEVKVKYSGATPFQESQRSSTWQQYYEVSENLNNPRKIKEEEKNDICIRCIRCRKYFWLTKNEQIWFYEKEFVLPKNCKGCREDKKSIKNGFIVY